MTRLPGGGEARALAGLVLLTVFLFSPAVLGGGVLWQRDIYGYWSAQVECFVRILAEGAPPLWNPYFSFGLPLLADPSYQVLYPVTWLNALLPPSTYYIFYACLHTAFSGVGLYLLARRWSQPRAAAFVAGAAWSACGPFLVLVSHIHHFGGAAWMPWVLLALESALAAPSLGSGLWLGAAAAAQLLAGSADICLMTGFTALAYLLMRPASPRHAPGSQARSLLAAIVSAAGLSAAQWLPTLAILRVAQRSEMSQEGNFYWSLHPLSLFDLVAPRLVSELPWNGPMRAALYESREPLFASLYLGAAAAVLFAAGLGGPWGRLRRWAFFGLLLSVLAALGRHTPFYPLLVRVTPLSLLRYPTKYMTAAGLFWAVLCGLAASDLLGGLDRRARRMAVATGAVIAILALGAAFWLARGGGLRDLLEAASQAAVLRAELKLVGVATVAALAGALAAWTRGARPAALALLALVVLDLAVVGRGTNPVAPPELLSYHPAVAGRVPPGSRLYVSMRQGRDWLSGQLARVPAGWERPWALALGNEDVAWPPLSARWGLRGSYDGDFTGLAPPLFSNLTLIARGAQGSPLGLRLLQMASVDYVVGADGGPWPGLDPMGDIQSVFANPLRLWRVPDPLPKSYVVDGVRVAVEPESVYLLGAPDLDPSREVILASGEPRAPAPGFEGGAQEIARRADRLSVRVHASAPAFVVFVETFHPGWNATVDGAPAGIVRANVLFRAVAVPAGVHVVDLEYRPTSVVWGLGISAVSGALGLWLGFGRRWVARRGTPAIASREAP